MCTCKCCVRSMSVCVCVCVRFGSGHKRPKPNPNGCACSSSCMLLPRRGMHHDVEDHVQIDVEDDVVAEDSDTDADATKW